MSAKLKAATVIAGGALTTLAIPAGGAQAALPPGTAGRHPGLTAPRPESATRQGSAAHSKAATPDVSCGGGDITWQDGYDNRYLEIYHSGTANGNWADAYPGNGTCTQQWFAVASSSTNFLCNGGSCQLAVYGMVNTNSDKCLAAPDTNIGNAHVVQESCGYSQYNYRWEEVPDKNGWNLVEPVDNGKWLLATDASIADIVAACEDVANRWIYTSHYWNAWSAYNCIWH